MELAKRCSIDGSCFEMLYLDEEAKIRMARVPAQSGIMICETDSGFSTPMAMIRTVVSRDRHDNLIRKVEFWNAYMVMRFRSVNGGYLNLEAVEEHYWQDVPFVEYINNEERIGDYEGVITEIDAYNLVQSNTANYFQSNDDAILKISKMGDVSEKEIQEMREKRAIILEDGGDLSWLLKTTRRWRTTRTGSGRTSTPWRTSPICVTSPLAEICPGWRSPTSCGGWSRCAPSRNGSSKKACSGGSS